MADAQPKAERGPGPPPLGLLFVEGQRALLEGMMLLPARSFLRSAPRGDGHPVLVLPGFTADDDSTGVMRRYLRQQGLSPHPWLCGRNLGAPGFLRERLIERVEELYKREGRKLSLVGWSLGGIYARELAKRMPNHVRQVVTLGSPFAAARSTNVGRFFEMVSGRALDSEEEALYAGLRKPPGVPSTAIVSRTDGVAHWRACLEPETERTENIVVPGSHCGLGVNALALYAIADRLSQPEGEWTPFDPSGWQSVLYS